MVPLLKHIHCIFAGNLIQHVQGNSHTEVQLHLGLPYTVPHHVR